jgi:hypothetical protein
MIARSARDRIEDVDGLRVVAQQDLVCLIG